MKYFGIKTPKCNNQDSYICWIATASYQSWDLFFQYPDKNMNFQSHRAPLEEAKRAYEAIGYRCVELNVTEVEKTSNDNNRNVDTLSSGGTIENKKSY